MKKYVILIGIIMAINNGIYSQGRITTGIENYDKSLKLLFQEKHNFTGSGHTEIMAFYCKVWWDHTSDDRIDKTYCFIVDEDRDEILKVYPVDYATYLQPPKYAIPMLLRFLGKNDLDWSALGTPVFFNNALHGYIGDFNKNGIDELYLYYFYGYGAEPCFLEFDRENNKFKVILQPAWGNYFIISRIYPDNNRLDFQGRAEGVHKTTHTFGMINHKCMCK
ncbi:MAG: hypothetical protein LBK74_10115 [Treponema sp.]|jgi:hypothetical protein|nr:hypothetical protein [Treponema sp.]